MAGFKRISMLLSVFLMPLCVCQGAGQARTAEEINRELGKGVNLGNALEAPVEGEWGVTLQESDFKLIAGAGFQSIRIPVRWSAHAAASPPYPIDSKFFERVDWVLDQAEKNKLCAILNIHHYDEIFADPESHRQRFIAIWEQISRRYAGRSDRLVFELLNEPHDKLDAARWNSLVKEAVPAIRRDNPTRIIMVGTPEWGGPWQIEKLELPDDTNLIVSFHYYEPFKFTHQGASWVGKSAEEWLGTKWMGKPEENDAVSKTFENIRKWGAEHKRPINLGEFGAYSKADLESRVRWTTCVRSQAEKCGFSWNYWEFRAGFGIYDGKTGKWLEPLRDALLPPREGNGKSPDLKP